MKEKHHSGASDGFLSCLAGTCLCFGIKKKGPVEERESSSYSTSSTQGYSANTLPDQPLGFASLVLSGNGGPMVFALAELNKATSNFSSSCQIGQGAFGTVYRGKLSNGSFVAIKRARKDTFEVRQTAQFQSEINMLANVEHLNLVKLIGYFEGGNERILVEEFVPNGNLREHLDCAYGVVLDLFLRLDIAIDVAHALTYLHLYADRPIIHRDVKASNVLLTENFRAKMCDFGFSRVGPLDSGVTHVSTQVKGTAGYLDPEYLKSYQLTPKSDVYSFGILLVELLTGRRPIEQARGIDERITVRWAFKKFLDGNLVELLDPKLEKSEATYFVMEKMAELAFQCSAPTKHDRPTMKKAAEFLWTIRKDYQELTQGEQQDGSRRSFSSQRNR